MKRLAKLRLNNLSLMFTIALFVVLYAVGANLFRGFSKPQVFLNLFIDNAHLIIASAGITFVLIMGGIDISIASTLAFTCMGCASLLQHGIDPWLAMLIMLLTGTAFGLLQGFLICHFELPPFIITLAGQFFMRGMCSVISTQSISIDNGLFSWFSQSRVLFPFLQTAKAVPFLTPGAIIALIVLIVCGLVLKFTQFGRRVYAIGGNEQSAVLMGIPVKRTQIFVYGISGFLASLAGLVYSFYTLAGYGLQNIGLELDAISSAVIGGTLLTGGVGSMLGTLMGVMIQGLIQVFIIFQGTLSSWWTKVAIAALLCLFIVFQRVLALGSEKTTREGKRL